MVLLGIGESFIDYFFTDIFLYIFFFLFLADTFCALFEKENGRVLFERILSDPTLNDAVRKYATIVFQNFDTRNKQPIQ
jgi:hypothetical protein